MSTPAPDPDLRTAVVVPARPGPVVRLGDLERGRDDTDELLDDLFGTPDDRGPGPVDAVLVIGGAAALVGAQAASLPTFVTVFGVAAVALGAVLPVRSLWQRLGSGRRSRRVRAMLGDGVLLRADHPSVARLLAAHQRLLDLSVQLAPTTRGRVEDVAHDAVLEVASVLGDRAPGDRAEIDYVHARTRALEELATTVADPRIGDGEADRRRALAEARLEVEQLTGRSSLTEAADLSRELLGDDGA